MRVRRVEIHNGPVSCDTGLLCAVLCRSLRSTGRCTVRYRSKRVTNSTSVGSAKCRGFLSLVSQPEKLHCQRDPSYVRCSDRVSCARFLSRMGRRAKMPKARASRYAQDLCSGVSSSDVSASSIAFKAAFQISNGCLILAALFRDGLARLFSTFKRCFSMAKS